MSAHDDGDHIADRPPPPVDFVSRHGTPPLVSCLLQYSVLTHWLPLHWTCHISPAHLLPVAVIIIQSQLLHFDHGAATKDDEFPWWDRSVEWRPRSSLQKTPHYRLLHVNGRYSRTIICRLIKVIARKNGTAVSQTRYHRHSFPADYEPTLGRVSSLPITGTSHHEDNNAPGDNK